MAESVRIAAAISNSARFVPKRCSRSIPPRPSGCAVAEPAYSVYLIRCGDGSLYTGIATDVARRLNEHETSPRGARYLRGRGPLTLVYQREIGDRSAATKVELAIKRLPRQEKSDLKILSRQVEATLVSIGAASTG